MQKKTRVYIERRLLKDSVFFEENECRELPKFYPDVVPRHGYFLDPALSSLGDSIAELEESSDEKHQELARQREYLIEHACSDGGETLYAVKRIRDDLKKAKEYAAIIDLACEAKYLSALSHPNIIQIKAIMGSAGKKNNFGVIMDRLSGTLGEKIAEWKQVVNPQHHTPKRTSRSRLWPLSTKLWCAISTCSAKKNTALLHHRRDDLFAERVLALSDVARGMKYLHSKRIIFRDLKPSNVGLTLGGTYVLFDFGLAKELKVVDLVEQQPDRYNATGLTGSRFFMAPEVATCQPYGFAADVFSFSMLMWEVMALDEAYPSHMDLNKHFERVILGGLRPRNLKRELPESLKTILKRSWATDPGERPAFSAIVDVLERCG
ncbi:MAG: hypothetical protein SGARI_004496, partial [Bacillariaceae sp.]